MGSTGDGQAMVDVIDTSGNAYEYHPLSGWQYLDSGVQSATPWVGASFLLYTNGVVKEYTDATFFKGASWAQVDSGIRSIAVSSLQGTWYFFELTSGGVLKDTYGYGWAVQDTGVQSFALGMRGGVDSVFELNSDGNLKTSVGSGWVVEDSGVQAMAFGSLGGVNYLLALHGDGELFTVSGSGVQLEDTGVLDMAFQTIGGTSYLTGDDGNGPFQWSALPV
jgi:hypothetical protein